MIMVILIMIRFWLRLNLKMSQPYSFLSLSMFLIYSSCWVPWIFILSHPPSDAEQEQPQLICSLQNLWSSMRFRYCYLCYYQPWYNYRQNSMILFYYWQIFGKECPPLSYKYSYKSNKWDQIIHFVCTTENSILQANIQICNSLWQQFHIIYHLSKCSIRSFICGPVYEYLGLMSRPSWLWVGWAIESSLSIYVICM